MGMVQHVVFAQGQFLDAAHPDGVCARLGFKWLACQQSGAEFKFYGANLAKTYDKQQAYLAAAAPHESKQPGFFQLIVNSLTEKFLNSWGTKHGMKFKHVLDAHTPEEFFKKYGSRSALLGQFGKTPTGGNWAHATALFVGEGGTRFFDANCGEYGFTEGSDVPGELSRHHRYLAGAGETLDNFSFFLVE